MITARRILAACAVLLAGGGLAVLLLPYDTTYVLPQVADQVNVDLEVPCKAPLVDLLTEESDDDWVDYSPDDGASFRSETRAGGEVCAASVVTRGTIGTGLLFLATLLAAAAIVAGRRRTDDDDSDVGRPVETGPPVDPAADAST